ncbi:hypothetical protein DFH09DRAFT_1075933 [Mycena vulgaris]|nr:hypothetical protein DFH09DRAFT_1075933 [Mycena vulgaris]
MPTPTEDEDYDDGSDLHLQLINYNASRDELIAVSLQIRVWIVLIVSAFQALKSSQLSLMKVLGENRELQKTNSELMAASTKKRRKGVEKDLLGYQPHITILAKKFLFTRALFIDSAMFRLNLPQPSERPEDQFVSDEAYRNSVTIALYQDIPEKLHSLLDAETYGSFAKDFIQEHSDGRSTLISIIRKTLPVILKGFNIDSDLLTTAGADRSNNEALKHFLCFPNERKATLYAPVLFPGPTRNMNELFTGPVVMKVHPNNGVLSDSNIAKVHRLMYFGPGSLVPGKKPAPNSNGIRMGLKQVTESSISAAGILITDTYGNIYLDTSAKWTTDSSPRMIMKAIKLNNGS